MRINEVTSAVIDAAITIHRELGPGLLESAYESCMCYLLRSRNIHVQNQVLVPIHFRGVSLDAGYRIDLLVDDRVIVEIKAVEKLNPIFATQVLSYLRLSELEVGLLVNFHETRLKDGIKRIVNQYGGPLPNAQRPARGRVSE